MFTFALLTEELWVRLLLVYPTVRSLVTALRLQFDSAWDYLVGWTALLAVAAQPWERPVPIGLLMPVSVHAALVVAGLALGYTVESTSQY